MASPNEDILWDDNTVLDDDSPVAPLPNHSVIVGSRFDGVDINDIPTWLQYLSRGDTILNINGTIHFYTVAEGGWYRLRSTVTLSTLCQNLDLHAPAEIRKS